jgi:carboxylesterase type B
LQRQTWFGDIFIDCPTALIASAAVNNDRNSSAVYKMIFDASTGFHGSTAPYLANTNLDWKGVENQTLAAIMTSYWISFAVTHDPNELRLPNAPVWPAYVSGGNVTAQAGDGVGFSTLVIADTTIDSARDRDVGARCDFIGDNGYVIMH